jgi:TP901 family phage tail tape measure protein/lambda family phage tail tape measure protein
VLALPLPGSRQSQPAHAKLARLPQTDAQNQQPLGAALAGSEFAYQLTFVKALGNETAETVARLSDAAKTLGQNSLQGPTELASGFRILAQAGLTGADSILAMSSVLDLAVVGEMEMAQAGTTLVGVMNAFSLSVNSASHVGDVFAKAAALSQTSVQGMTEAMKTASVVGEQYGASMEDVATALTLLAKVNITGTAAGTSLRNMLKELYAPTAGAASAFKQLGISTSDAGGKLKSFPTIIYELRGQLEKFDKPSQINILQKMFGERGAKEAISMLALTREEWDKLNGSISQSSGFMRNVAADLEGTTKGAFTQAINALKTSFVTAFESTEGPMKAMALRLQSLFSSQEFQDGVVSAVSLIGKFASALLSAASGLSTLVALMPNGTATFVTMAAAVGGTTLALTTMASRVASASGLLSGFGIAGMAALSPLAPLYIAVGALTAAYVLFNSKTPESISNINALNFALDTQISRLKLVNSELIKKIGLESGNAAVESAAARKEIVAGKAQLAEYDNVLAADAASKKSGQSTVIGDMLGNIFTTDEKKREGYAKVIEARTKRSELAAKIAKAELNLKIAEGYEDEIRINSAKAQVKDLLKQQEAESKLKTGTGKFVPDEKPARGGSTKVRDYSGDLEKSNIASLVERQQEDIKVLELTHKNHLITEEQYQAQLVGVYATWGPRIEEEYSSSIARLAKLQAASSGDQAAQYEKKRKDMETAYRKFQFDEAYRSADSLAAEMGRIKKSGEEIQKVLEEQQANTDQIMERLAATRIKLDLTPEQAAGYDARKAVEKPLDKSIAGKRAEEQNLLNAGYSEESASLKAVRAEIELLIEARARLGGQAAAQAEAEVSFARSYEYGWKSAFRAWTDEGANAAKTAADSFAVMTNGMESLIDNFLTTGKLGFADFAKSVILSIAKIEARAALSQGLKAVGGNGGGGFGGIISGILGAITGGGGGGFSSGDFANLASSFIDSAKGNVFSGSPSLHAYANTVQTSPKTFAFQNLHGFARGGVFAEAGPEAVMPLSRDSRGRLGVKASSEGGPINITVHVNGNSNAPDVRRAAGQGAREALAAFNGARRYA